MLSACLLASMWSTLTPLPQGAEPERSYPLMVGDAAPVLVASSWVGDPVKTFEPGQVYVLDFFATWCGPCREAMPDLSAMHKKHGKRASFIAVDVWDYQERVRDFATRMGEKLDYPIALDVLPSAPPADTGNIPMWCKDHGANSQAWLAASGMAENGIPALFVVDGAGRVAWIGDEVRELETVLARVVDGQWDLAAEAKRYAAKAVALKQGRPLVKQLRDLDRARDWSGFVAVADRLVALDAAFHGYAGTRFQTTLLRLEDKEAAYSYARAQLPTNTAISAFGQMSYVIVFMGTDHGPADLELAEQLATRANELSKGQRPSPLETLARIAFLRGQKDKAIAFQEQAIAVVKDAGAKKEAESRLQEYRQM